MYLSINGGRRLNGQVGIASAKNSVLPIIACCIMIPHEVEIKNCPPLKDVLSMTQIIKHLGGTAHFENNSLYINCKNATFKPINDDLTRPIRSSVFILGALLSRFKMAKISPPGGCEIGTRPIDIHLDALKTLGVKINLENNMIDCDGTNISAQRIKLRFPSVGATENLIMSATLTKGRTIIENVAKEPEVSDLARFINRLGGKIYGIGTSRIVVDGVSGLSGGKFSPIPDRIVAGTYMSAVATAGGKITLNNVNFSHLRAVIDKFSQAGCEFIKHNNAITVVSSGRLRAIESTVTLPFPDFPTDMQPQLCAMMATANGVSVIKENLFDARFSYTSELIKMGANIKVNDEQTEAVICGVDCLEGAKVFAKDLRGGASLVVACLGARGNSSVFGLEHIERGYYQIEQDLSMLNADIKLI